MLAAFSVGSDSGGVDPTSYELVSPLDTIEVQMQSLLDIYISGLCAGIAAAL